MIIDNHKFLSNLKKNNKKYIIKVNDKKRSNTIYYFTFSNYIFT